MAWWKIVLIVIFALLLIFALAFCFLANAAIDMFLKPESFWWKKAPWGSEPHYQKNEKEIRERAEAWNSKVKSEDLYVTTDSGLKLHAVCYKNEQFTSSHKWVLIVHGYRGDLSNTRCYAVNYYEKGYNVLLPENRTTGQSQGRYIGMGYLEKTDNLLWLNKILELDNNAEIVLHGESMGSATVMMMTGLELPKEVKCAVADCGYTSVWNQFDYIMKGKKRFLLKLTSSFAKIRIGYGFKEASSVEALKKSKTPTIFIHGADDDFVPTFMLEENYNALSLTEDKKEKHVFEGAAHCGSEFINPDLYWKTVFNFIEKYL